MIRLPIIERELLVEARHASTWWARVLVSLLGMLALLCMPVWGRIDYPGGSQLFYLINMLFFAAVWVLVPLLTADALSREHRENTLGLLFLAGLKPVEIVIGKGIAQAVRGLNLMLVIIPLQIVPIILGGITWIELVIALLVNSVSILLALSAGLLASAISRKWWTTAPLALLLGGLLLDGFTTTLHLGQQAVRFAWGMGPPLQSGGALQQLSETAFAPWRNGSWSDRIDLQLTAATGGHPRLSGTSAVGWANLITNDRAGLLSIPLLAVSVAICLGAILVARMTLRLATMAVAHNWRSRPPSARAGRWHRFWVAPRFLRQHLRKRLTAALGRNPVGWLHQRSWRRRLTKWGWFLLVAIAAGLLLRESVNAIELVPRALRGLGLTLLLSLAFTAANSFRAEMESGALELLQVSPLSDMTILQGRLAGVASQYLPSSVLLVGVWAAVYFDLPDRYFNLRFELHWAEPLVFLSTAATMAITGALQSVRRQPPFRGWLLAIVRGGLIPLLLASSLTFSAISLGLFSEPSSVGAAGGMPDPAQVLWLAAFGITQILVACRSWLQARRVLSNHEMLSASA